jgi:hypothetical protein
MLIGMTDMIVHLLIALLVNVGVFRLSNQPDWTFSRKIRMGAFMLFCVSIAVVLVDAWRLQNHIGNGGYYGFPVLGIVLAFSLISVGILFALGAAITHFVRYWSKK